MTLALDLGLHTGWAHRDNCGVLRSGTLDLSKSKQRELDLAAFLDDIGFDIGYYEQVAIEAPIVYPGRLNAANVLFSFAGVVRLHCQRCDKQLSEYKPTAIKKAVTGKGNAKKDLVMLCMADKFPGHRIYTADQADALAVLWMHEVMQCES